MPRMYLRQCFAARQSDSFHLLINLDSTPAAWARSGRVSVAAYRMEPANLGKGRSRANSCSSSVAVTGLKPVERGVLAGLQSDMSKQQVFHIMFLREKQFLIRSIPMNIDTQKVSDGSRV